MYIIQKGNTYLEEEKLWRGKDWRLYGDVLEERGKEFWVRSQTKNLKSCYSISRKTSF